MTYFSVAALQRPSQAAAQTVASDLANRIKNQITEDQAIAAISSYRFLDIQNMNQATTLQLPDHEKGQTQLT